jgi:hypothetical protein
MASGFVDAGDGGGGPVPVVMVVAVEMVVAICLAAPEDFSAMGFVATPGKATRKLKSGKHCDWNFIGIETVAVALFWSI